MASVKEMAKSYEGMQTKNICELEKVSVDLEVYEKTFKMNSGEEFTVNCVNVDGEEYKVPASVLRDLKAILEKKPELSHFTVGRTGSGMNTKYTVIPQ